MFRRLFWLMVGAGFGFGVAFWLTRAMRSTVQRYAPERLGGELARALQALGSDLRAAISEGRKAMREREAQLRADLERRP